MRESWRLRESQWWRRKRPSVGAVSPAAVVVLAALGCLAGCAPTPTPSPTPTAAFASEEEAYAAAEEVYRAYNDAGNARRAGESDADPQRYLAGLALEGDIDTQNLLSSSELHASGAASVESFAGESLRLDGTFATIIGVVCLDASGVALLDSSGNDVTPPERGDIISQRVTFGGADGSLLILDEAVSGGSTC